MNNTFTRAWFIATLIVTQSMAFTACKDNPDVSLVRNEADVNTKNTEATSGDKKKMVSEQEVARLTRELAFLIIDNKRNELQSVLVDMQKLIDDGADVNGSHPRYGDSLLKMATEFGGYTSFNEEKVRLLIENGADPESTDKYGLSALNYAAMERQIDIVKLLMDTGISWDSKQAGLSFIIAARESDNIDMIKLFLENGTNIDWTPATQTSPYFDGPSSICNNYSMKHDVYLGGGLEPGRTALINAAAFNNVEIYDYLLESGADVNAQDIDGRSALLLATGMKGLEQLKKTLAKGAYPHVVDDQGNGLLMYILGKVRREPVYTERVKWAIEQGVTLNQENCEGLTPLAYMKQKFSKYPSTVYAEVIEILKQAGAKE